MLKIVSENFIHALLLFLGLFLKISRWVPLFLPQLKEVLIIFRSFLYSYVMFNNWPLIRYSLYTDLPDKELDGTIVEKASGKSGRKLFVSTLKEVLT